MNGISPELLLMIGCVALAASVCAGIWLWARRRVTPEERERRRRLDVSRRGRMVDATVIDVHEDELTFTYEVAGIVYTTSQNVGALRTLLPEDLMRTIGPGVAKYNLSNPANSIMVCEEWSGIRHLENP